MAATEQHLEFEDKLLLHCTKSIRECIPYVMAKIIEWGCPKRSDQSFEDYMKEIGVYGSKRVSKTMKTSNKLKQTNTNNLDVTFLYQLAGLVCTDLESPGTETWKVKYADNTSLEYLLKEASEYRNVLVHDKEPAERPGTVCDIENVCYKILAAGEKLYQQSGERSKREIHEMFTHIKNVGRTTKLSNVRQSVDVERNYFITPLESSINVDQPNPASSAITRCQQGYPTNGPQTYDQFPAVGSTDDNLPRYFDQQRATTNGVRRNQTLFSPHMRHLGSQRRRSATDLARAQNDINKARCLSDIHRITSEYQLKNQQILDNLAHDLNSQQGSDMSLLAVDLQKDLSLNRQSRTFQALNQITQPRDRSIPNLATRQRVNLARKQWDLQKSAMANDLLSQLSTNQMSQVPNRRDIKISTLRL